ITDYPGNNASVSEVYAGLRAAIPMHVKNMIAAFKKIPGTNEINAEDFQKMMLHRGMDYYMLKYSCILVNGECYQIYPNGLQYTRRWMTQMHGKKMVSRMFDFANKFNNLNLHEQELALIYPIVLCTDDHTLDDPETVRSIKACFSYALYAQMCVTRKEQNAKMLFEQLFKVLELLNPLNAIYEKSVGSLVLEKTD
ncbi:unnamed protein product, partial [Didymodactylos carnosus]